MNQKSAARRAITVCSILAIALGFGPAFGGIPCEVPDNGSGTVDLPPPGCGYLSPTDVHQIIDGLPPGTTINLGVQHRDFFNVTTGPGGPLGGEIESFGSGLFIAIEGTGSLAGYSRTVNLQAQCETHVGPRDLGAPVQDFPTDMFRLQAQLPPGDPDFDLLQITAGSQFSMPSPGHTTLTRLPSGNFNVDSFFDIAYRIDFSGAPSGPLSGMSGSTTGTIRMQAGIPAASCPPIPAGTDTFPSTAKLVVQPCQPSGGTTCTPQGNPIVLRATSANQPPTVVQRQPQVADEIPVEIVSLQLTGTHPALAGPIAIRESPSLQSLGQLTHVEQDPTTCDFVSADSFFDVFVEIDVQGLGETWINPPSQPLHLRERIYSLPPRDARYENPFVRPVKLFDQATGGIRAEVTYEIHHTDPPFPPPGPDCFETTLTGTIDIFSPPLTTTVVASGPTTVHRGPEFPPNVCVPQSLNPCTSDANCVAPNRCNVDGAIPIEIREMNLQGSNPVLGQIQIQQHPNHPSRGATVSLPPSGTYAVDSFFDVFVEIDTQMGQLESRPPQSTVVRAQHGNLPPSPGTPFAQPPGQSTQLFPVGSPNPFGRIRNVIHTTGPPADWQPPPPGDDYCFDSWITLEVEVFTNGCTETLMLPSPFRVLRGGPSDLDGDGRETMQSLIAKLAASGSSSCLGGTILARLQPSAVSSGRIESLAPAEFFPADSFFDVFVEIDTPAGTVRPASSVHMETTINSLPPEDGEIYYGPGTVLPLVDSGGAIIGRITEVSHEIHRTVVCPFDCLPHLTFPSKVALSTALPLAGGGLTYDVLRGPLATLRSTGDFTGATCLQEDLGSTVPDATTPLPNQGFYYVARDGFADMAGTLNSGGSGQVADRDLLAQPCTP